jgi:hypothetical protein
MSYKKCQFGTTCLKNIKIIKKQSKKINPKKIEKIMAWPGHPILSFGVVSETTPRPSLGVV